MSVQVRCPFCHTVWPAEDDRPGVLVSCPTCGREVAVQPSVAQAAGAAPAQEPLPVVTAMPIGYAGASGGNGKAVAALVLGIISIPACMVYGVPSLICGVLAVVFGVLSKRAIRRLEMSPTAAGMAKAGFICGLVGIILSVVVWGAIIAFFLYAMRSISHTVPPMPYGPSPMVAPRPLPHGTGGSSGSPSPYGPGGGTTGSGSGVYGPGAPDKDENSSDGVDSPRGPRSYGPSTESDG